MECSGPSRNSLESVKGMGTVYILYASLRVQEGTCVWVMHVRVFQVLSACPSLTLESSSPVLLPRPRYLQILRDFLASDSDYEEEQHVQG